MSKLGKGSKILVFILILLIFLQTVFSISYISEIKFKGDEYVEFFSEEKLNLSNKFVKDNGNKNEIFLLKYTNSNYNLIIGNNFKNNFDISKLNCNIYETRKSGPGNSGLKNSGENITLIFNSTTNFSYINNISENLDISEDKSLHFNYTSKKNSLKKFSPCVENFLENNKINGTGEKIPIVDNSSIFIYDLEDNYFLKNNKIKFKVNTKLDFYKIEYWIQNRNSVIIKNKLNTTNLNVKTYTIKDDNDYLEIYHIFSKIFYKNKSLENSSKIIMSKFVYDSKNNLIQIKSSTDTNTKKIKVENLEEIEKYGKKSIIKILNEEDIINQKTNKLNLFFWKSEDSSKRTIYVKLNGFDIFKLSNIKKNSKTELQINLPLDYGKNNFLEIYGIDKKIELNINTSKVFVSKNLEIKNLGQSNQILYFNLFNIENLEGFCYVSYGRSKISDEIKLEKSMRIKLSVKKLTKKYLKDIYSLTLNCKNKKKGLKTFRNEKIEFTLNIANLNLNKKDFKNLEVFKKLNEKIGNINLKNEDLNDNIENENNNNQDFKNEDKFFNTNEKNLIQDSLNKKLISKNNTEYNFSSRGEKLKNDSLYYFLSIMIFLLIIFILKR